MVMPSKRLALVETTTLNNFGPVMTSRSKKPNLQTAEAVGPSLWEALLATVVVENSRELI